MNYNIYTLEWWWLCYDVDWVDEDFSSEGWMLVVEKSFSFLL
jgi:hypothetical protein